MKKLLTLTVILLVLIAGVPWGLYGLGMKNMTQSPIPPGRLVYSQMEENRVWKARRESLPSTLRSITPWHFYHLLWCSRNDRDLEDFLTCGNLYPGLRAAAYAAKYHLRNHMERDGVIWRYLSRTALAIHISGAWTKDELMAYLVGIHRSGYVGE
ncbi:MAG: hypothetical protein GY703_00060 [Gammaproteobacteria bacterium]|nr:hypothetical protein [Gammaproteobacteria bacterium]